MSELQINAHVPPNVNCGIATLLRTCAMLAALMLGHAPPANSCGYHDPKMFAQGILNHIYPNALHVTGAIWAAQKEGKLSMPDRERIVATGERGKFLDQLEYEKTLSALHALGEAIKTKSEGKESMDISVVVLTNVLWSRFSNDYLDIRQGLHVKGPGASDLIIVSDQPVLQAIRNGRLSFREALDLGVVRLYGPEQDKSELTARLGDIGKLPLPRPDLPTPGVAGLFETSVPSSGFQ